MKNDKSNCRKLFSILKKFQFKKLYKISKNKILTIIESKKYYDHKPSQENVGFENVYDTRNKKIVIYTCISGNYDDICVPKIKENNVDYIMFTNNEKIKKNNNIWTIENIPENVAKLNDNVLINRYIKMHPHKLFKDYDISIYID